jgi:hypothetical protein
VLWWWGKKSLFPFFCFAKILYLWQSFLFTNNKESSIYLKIIIKQVIIIMKKFFILILCFLGLTVFSQTKSKAQLQADMDQLTKELIAATQTTSSPQKNTAVKGKATVNNSSATEIAQLKERISALKQDSAFIHEKLDFYEKMNADTEYSVSSFSSQFEVKVLSCKGDRGAQTVQVEYVIKHRKVNQKVGSSHSGCQAYDEIGNAFEIDNISLGTDYIDYRQVLVPTDVAIKGTVTFKRILGGTEKFKQVNIFMSTSDADGGTNRIEGITSIKNLKINW